MNNAPCPHPIPTTEDQAEPGSDEPDGAQAGLPTPGKPNPRPAQARFLQLLLFLFLGTSALWARIPQPILITKGTVLIRGSGPGGGNDSNSVFVGGHCGYFDGRGGPTPGDGLGVLGGKIEVRLAGGTTRQSTLASALKDKWVEYGDSTYNPQRRPIFKVRFDLHPDVKSIRFLTHAALVDDSVAYRQLSAAERQSVVDQSLQDLTPSDSPARVQNNIWLRHMGLVATRRQVKDEPLVTVRSASLDPAHHMSVEFLRMPVQAGASVIRTPGGRLIVHDAGGPVESLLKALGKLPESNGKHRISILITHTDLDHFSALLQALESGTLEARNVEIGELIIGCDPQALSEGPSGKRLARLVAALLKRGFLLDESQKDFAHFTRSGAARTPVLPMFNTRPQPGEPLLYHFEPEPGFKVVLSRLGNPPANSRDRHAHNLAAFYSNNGSGIWSLGDASVQQLGEMIEPGVLDSSWVPKPGVPRARCILWPHHAWRPTRDADRQTMKDFLKAMRTEAVFVGMSSEPNTAARERFQDIQALIREVERELAAEGVQLNIQVHTTSEAHLRFQAILYLLQQESAEG